MGLMGRTTELAEAWLDTLPERRAGPAEDYDALVARFGGPLPERPEDPEAVIVALAGAAEPGLAASAGPRYFGFVTGGSLPAALAADWLAASWDQNAFTAIASPAAAAIEQVAAGWALEALALPPTAGVGFVTGATAGNVVGLAAARHHVLAVAGWDVEADGLIGAPPIRVLVGDEVHASLLVALRIVGLGAGRAIRVAVDGQGAMRADALAGALEAGTGPAIVCAQAGNVNTGAIDPLAAIAEIASGHGAWVHVDGAFGLWAAASPRLRHLLDGVAAADSWSVDAHKWLNVPYDSALAIVARPDVQRAAMGVAASYLPGGTSRNGFDYAPEMSRRARAIPVYAALRSLGRSGLGELVDRCCALARRAAERLAALVGVTVLNEVVLNQVLVRFGDDDALTQAVVAAVQRDGTAWLGGTVWQGRAAMRISVSNWMTAEADIDRLVDAVRHAHEAATRGTAAVR